MFVEGIIRQKGLLVFAAFVHFRLGTYDCQVSSSLVWLIFIAVIAVGALGASILIVLRNVRDLIEV